MNNNEELIQDIITSFESLTDPKRVEFAKKNYPTSSKVLGVTVPNEKLVAKEMKAKLQEFDERRRIEFIKQLMKTNIFECQHIALEYFEKDKKAFKFLNESDLDDLAISMDNWVLVDTFGCLIAGNMWRENMIPDARILSWLESDNFWFRRIAIVATVSLNLKARGGKGDPIKTLMVCEKVVEDHHDMIIKALSWALRALAARMPEPVIDFIEKHNTKLHKKIIREVLNKIEKGTKN